jgi:Right handed beta helix region/Pectate lyase superfamily protein
MQKNGCLIRSILASFMKNGMGIALLYAVLSSIPSAVVGQVAKAPNLDVALKNAIGDGKADDTEAIQHTIDSHGSSIVLAPGRYRVTRPLVVDLDKSGFVSFSGNGVATIIMEGPGPAIRFIGTHQGTADPQTVKKDVWDRQRAPMIDGLEFVGSHPEAVGIEANGTMQLTLTRLIVRNVLHAIHLTNRNRNILIAHCHLYENRGVGVFLDDVDLHQINVNACHISYNQQGGIVSRRGNVRNLHISGCDIESNMNPATPPTANVLIDCTESQHGTAEVAITGCTIQHNSKSPDSANIRIVGHGLMKANQPEVRWGNTTITGNVLSDVATNIHLKECRGVTIQGNTLWMGYAHSLFIESCSNIVVGSNNLDRNPRYDYGDAAKSKNAVLFRNCDDCTIQGLHVTNVHESAAGIEFDRCRRLNISSCTILDCDGPGIILRSVSQSLITGCLIRDDRETRKPSPSLRIEASQDNTLSNNVLSHGSETLPKANAG